MNAGTPMFPLGTVLVPGAAISLHIFEERYRQMTRYCIENEAEFGVVLISRGSEVGGGETRADVGCLARIDTAEQSPDGRWSLACSGTERFKVAEWMKDDPYPVAICERWPDPRTNNDAVQELSKRSESLVRLIRRTLAMAAEAGASVAPATVPLVADPGLIAYEAVATGLIGPLDAYNILATEGPADRLEAARDVLEGVQELLRLDLGSQQ